jgi:threonine aldolase
VRTASELSARLKERGVLANGVTPQTMRMVTHLDVDAAMIERSLQASADAVCRKRG